MLLTTESSLQLRDFISVQSLCKAVTFKWHFHTATSCTLLTPFTYPFFLCPIPSTGPLLFQNSSPSASTPWGFVLFPKAGLWLWGKTQAFCLPESSYFVQHHDFQLHLFSQKWHDCLLCGWIKHVVHLYHIFCMQPTIEHLGWFSKLTVVGSEAVSKSAHTSQVYTAFSSSRRMSKSGIAGSQSSYHVS